jgi:hypothetical protein
LRTALRAATHIAAARGQDRTCRSAATLRACAPCKHTGGASPAVSLRCCVCLCLRQVDSAARALSGSGRPVADHCTLRHLSACESGADAETVRLPVALADSDRQIAVALPLSLMAPVRATARAGEVECARRTTFRCNTACAFAAAAGGAGPGEVADQGARSAVSTGSDTTRGSPNGAPKRKRVHSGGPDGQADSGSESA